ncbi:S-adenosyl-L-homocysteine hydrolase [Novosphingobium sp. 9U]|uniref:S-adenosyl-L-homocysteine hydrolase n=1 Tax=Novosphingobium sp. 9U TaxID=2653158 RepID=UPI00135AA55F|nr:S-adenosyl-L-homocysteine hydrolase [Novosphingobium sp. 9U]
MPSDDAADQLHRLDVMLQTTGKHCSKTRSDFRRDYAAFSQAHRAALTQAAREIRGELAQRYGRDRATNAFERMNMRIATQYRGGHPWLDCEELQTVTRGLVMVQGSATLVEAADQILPKRRVVRFAMARN